MTSGSTFEAAIARGNLCKNAHCTNIGAPGLSFFLSVNPTWSIRQQCETLG